MTLLQLVFGWLFIGLILDIGLGFLAWFLFGHSEGYQEARYDLDYVYKKCFEEDYL